MKDKTNEELWQMIRSGNEEEAGQAMAELKRRETEAAVAMEELEEKKKEALKNALKGAIPAIITRNMSHGTGEYACSCLKKKQDKRRDTHIPDHTCLGEGAGCKCGGKCQCKEDKK